MKVNINDVIANKHVSHCMQHQVYICIVSKHFIIDLFENSTFSQQVCPQFYFTSHIFLTHYAIATVLINNF